MGSADHNAIQVNLIFWDNCLLYILANNGRLTVSTTKDITLQCQEWKLTHLTLKRVGVQLAVSHVQLHQSFTSAHIVWLYVYCNIRLYGPSTYFFIHNYSHLRLFSQCCQTVDINQNNSTILYSRIISLYHTSQLRISALHLATLLATNYGQQQLYLL